LPGECRAWNNIFICSDRANIFRPDVSWQVPFEKDKLFVVTFVIIFFLEYHFDYTYDYVNAKLTFGRGDDVSNKAIDPKG